MGRSLRLAVAVFIVLSAALPVQAGSIDRTLDAIERGDVPARVRTARIARAAIESRLALVGSVLPSERRDDLSTTLDKVGLAHELLGVQGDPFARARAVARLEAARHLPVYATTPRVLGGMPDARVLSRLASYPEPARSALSDLVRAFAAFDDAARRDPDGAAVVGARIAVLDAAARVRDVRDVRATTGGPLEPIDLPPLARIDLTETSSVVATDYALVVDGGGDDTYLNNAGGSGIVAVGESCVPEDWGTDVPLSAGGAVLIDLGGNDSYGDATNRRDCGVNGGGVNGAGFLLDAGGDDRYVGGMGGVNGGGFHGSGFLADLGGADLYDAKGWGVNGGTRFGFGFLYDGGDAADAYIAPAFDYWYAVGTNGGAAGGLAFLYDEGGDDRYLTAGGGTNGGGWGYGSTGVWSQGFLLDGGGSDVYDVDKESGNGAGYIGNGFLYDAGAGDDLYDGNTWMEEGSNGAGVEGVGFLLDEGGDDVYTASDYGANGGGIAAGAGFLIDRAGNDAYTAGADATNGAGWLGAGFLYDATGTDTYRDALVDCMDCSVVPKDVAGAQIDGP